MKQKTFKFNKLILSVSSLLFLASPALADKKPHCEISTSPWLTYSCSMNDSGTQDYISYNDIQLTNPVFYTEFKDKSLVLNRTDGGNEGAMFFKVVIDPDQVSGTPEVNYEVRKFESITHSTTGANANASGAYFIVESAPGKTAKAKAKVSFDRGNTTESTITATSNGSDAQGIRADYKAAGYQKFKLANPNLKIKANAQGGTSYGVRNLIEEIDPNSYSSLTSEIIQADITSISDADAQGINISSGTNAAKVTLNNTLDKSLLVVKGATSTIGLKALQAAGNEGAVSAAASNSTIYVSGAKKNTGIEAFAAHDAGLDANSAEATQSNNTIIYVGGSLNTTDPAGVSWTADDSTTATNIGLFAHASDQALAKTEQNGGQLFVSGAGKAKDLDNLNAGLYAHGGKTHVEQYKASDKIVVTGDNTAAIIARATTQGNTIRVKGSLEAKDFGIYSSSPVKQTSDITIYSGAKIYADVAIFNDDGDSNIDFIDDITLGKADQKTKILLGGGTDSLDMNNINLDHVTEIDGGADEDTLNLSGYKGLALDTRFKNWEGIKLEHGTYILKDGLAVTKSTGALSEEKSLYLRNNVELVIDSPEVNLDGDVYAEGSTIDLSRNSDAQGRKLTVYNYTSFKNKLFLNLGDLLVVNGKVTGSNTEVTISKGSKDIKPSDNGIQIVSVSDTSPVETKNFAFSLTDSLAVGAYEYNKIEFSDESGHRGFYLKSKPLAVTPAVTPSTKLLRKDVVGYALTQQLHGQTLATINSNYHSRLGQVSDQDFSNPAWRSWARLLVNSRHLEAENLKADTNEHGLQAGWDFLSFTNSRTGISASYQKVETNFGDSFRSNHHIPGKLESDLSALNIYHTLKVADAYFDVNAGLHFIHNDYQIKDGGKGNAYGASLALEGGYKFNFGSIFLEPEVQLSYQLTNYLGFEDKVSSVEGYKHHSLVPSLGFRLGYQGAKGSALWLDTQVAQELFKATDLVVSGDTIKTSLANKTTYKVALNGQVALSSYAKLYSNLSYQGSHNRSTYHRVSGQVGLSFTWR